MKIVDRFGSRPEAELVRLPQGGDALVGSIVGVALVQSGPGGILDGLGGIQVRLPDGEHGAVRNLPGHVGIHSDAAAFQG